MGINVAQIYVAWNFHEETPGVFNFDYDRNVTEFIKIAQELGLYVNLRIGPYICAEWTHGGLPWWLLKYDDIKLRTNEGPYWEHAKRWIKRISEEVKGLQYPNGPVLLIQLENEYGSYVGDRKYMDELVAYAKHCGLTKVPLFTTDGPGDGFLKNGVAKGAFPTIDFGAVGSFDSVKNYFEAQRRFSKCGPYVNSEFYPGWFAGWLSPKPVYSSIHGIVSTMQWMRDLNASFSFYMIHGGTNWGFTSGAETDAYIATTYDYGAPIDEAGQLTEKYLRVREFIGNLSDPLLKPLPVPENHTAFEVKDLELNRLDYSLPDFFMKFGTSKCEKTDEPQNFEKFGQGEGYAIYYHDLIKIPKEIHIETFRNLIYFFIDDEYQGFIGPCCMERCHNKTIQLKSINKSKGRLYLIAENLGRLNFRRGIDTKGVLSPVLGDGEPIKDWYQCQTKKIGGIKPKKNLKYAKNDAPNAPGIYVGKISLNETDNRPGTFTYFDSKSIGKGQLVVNDINIGRAWPEAGPLSTLYLPGAYLHLQGSNVFAYISFAPNPSTIKFDLVKEHRWYPVPKNQLYAKKPRVWDRW
ncbi:unnamed protein product [Bursaphelenchus xylophilus]|uniref:(pine wood nematode) hypothetical protein n=1 Tax=Bursaphelenchus xylophilus TaxID=6326 RepID=A0A1I7RSV8_BURXY|nr:unnamed protein product [Bursaphelenchus xylophilus]CAG9122786.1 unnamed protein product [Bursaphelenchus xylophilus]